MKNLVALLIISGFLGGCGKDSSVSSRMQSADEAPREFVPIPVEWPLRAIPVGAKFSFVDAVILPPSRTDFGIWNVVTWQNQRPAHYSTCTVSVPVSSQPIEIRTTDTFLIKDIAFHDPAFPDVTQDVLLATIESEGGMRLDLDCWHIDSWLELPCLGCNGGSRSRNDYLDLTLSQMLDMFHISVPEELTRPVRP